MISIIIVNYRQKDFLAKCVQSIYSNLNNNNFEVIIVNNSKEENLSDLKKSFHLQIIESENTGFSKANNLAAKVVKGEHLLFLNADMEIVNDFTEDLINKFQNTDFGAVGLKLQYKDGRFQNSFGLFPTILNEYRNKKTELAFRKNHLKFIKERESKYSEIKEVEWVTGAALYIKKNTFDKVGGFDERFFLFYEDIDLCFRLHKSGFKNYFYPYSKIIHHKGENLRKEFKKESGKIQKESRILYYILHNKSFQLLLLKIYFFFKKID
ncbi:MAG: glycosyltransferase family 2 protein [Chlorobi bacterium]|nr:glycosyltransferase family 2 protein [Chlorobiota bacterium]MCI0716658.1 glycosyltransferase family 2 protein [Chlorobiota bacterium]